MKDYYEILEVNPKASKYIIEKVYRIQVKKFHPDLHQDEQKKKECKLKIKEINKAYEILSNDEKRKNYDITMKELKNRELTDNERFISIQQENIELRKKVQELINRNDSLIQKKEEHKRNDTVRQIKIENTNKNFAKNRYKEIVIEKLKSLLALLITAVIIISILWICYAIPEIKEFILKDIFMIKI